MNLNNEMLPNTAISFAHAGRSPQRRYLLGTLHGDMNVLRRVHVLVGLEDGQGVRCLDELRDGVPHLLRFLDQSRYVLRVDDFVNSQVDARVLWRIARRPQRERGLQRNRVSMEYRTRSNVSCTYVRRTKDLLHKAKELHSLGVPVRLWTARRDDRTWREVLPFGSPFEYVRALLRLRAGDVGEKSAEEVEIGVRVEDRMRAVNSKRRLAVHVGDEEAAEILLNTVRTRVRQTALVADLDDVLRSVVAVDEFKRVDSPRLRLLSTGRGRVDPGGEVRVVHADDHRGAQDRRDEPEAQSVSNGGKGAQGWRRCGTHRQ